MISFSGVRFASNQHVTSPGFDSVPSTKYILTVKNLAESNAVKEELQKWADETEFKAVVLNDMNAGQVRIKVYDQAYPEFEERFGDKVEIHSDITVTTQNR